jgi:hypothetical protein
VSLDGLFKFIPELESVGELGSSLVRISSNAAVVGNVTDFCAAKAVLVDTKHSARIKLSTTVLLIFRYFFILNPSVTILIMINNIMSIFCYKEGFGPIWVPSLAQGGGTTMLFCIKK